MTASLPAVDARWNHVVLIKTHALDRDGSDVPAYCNGTFLSPRLIVTAAHCVLEAQALKSFAVEIQMGAYKFITKPDGTLVRVGYVSQKQTTEVARFHFTPAITKSIESRGRDARLGPGDDMAVIELNHDYDRSLGLFPLVQSQEVAAIQKNLAGFHPTVVTINFMEEMSTDVRRQAELPMANWSLGRYITSKSASRVQEGDSGSPVFALINGTWKLFAVVKGRAETLFSNWDVFPTTDGNLCAISVQMSPENQKILCR